MSKQPRQSPSTSASPAPLAKVGGKKDEIEFVGYPFHQIMGAKLPSNRQVLKVFFYNIRHVHLNQRESARLTIRAVLVYWEQARIPTPIEKTCIERLLKLYETWKNIRKHAASARTGLKKQLEQEFVDTLDDLFDLAHADAMNLMRIEEDKKFLILQRQKGRPGCMSGIDLKLYLREKRSMERERMDMARQEKEQARKRSFTEMMQNGTYFDMAPHPMTHTE